MGTCGGADPAGVTIRLAVYLGRLFFSCGYNVHRYSGIDLASTTGSVFGKSKAAAAASGVTETGSPPYSGGGATAFAGGPSAAGVGMIAGGAALAVGAATMIVPGAGRGSSAARSVGVYASSDEAASLVRADAAGGGGVASGNAHAGGGCGGDGGVVGPADDDAFDVVAGHLYFLNSHAEVCQFAIMGHVRPIATV